MDKIKDLFKQFIIITKNNKLYLTCVQVNKYKFFKNYIDEYDEKKIMLDWSNEDENSVYFLLYFILKKDIKFFDEMSKDEIINLLKISHKFEINDVFGDTFIYYYKKYFDKSDFNILIDFHLDKKIYLDEIPLCQYIAINILNDKILWKKIDIENEIDFQFNYLFNINLFLKDFQNDMKTYEYLEKTHKNFYMIENDLYKINEIIDIFYIFYDYRTFDIFLSDKNIDCYEYMSNFCKFLINYSKDYKFYQIILRNLE